jgi:general secretion pathway protein A
VYGARIAPAPVSASGPAATVGVNPWAAAIVAVGALAAGVSLAPRFMLTTPTMAAADPAASAVPGVTAVNDAPAQTRAAQTPATPIAAPQKATSPTTSPPTAISSSLASTATLAKTAVASGSLDSLFSPAVAADEATAWRALARLWGAALGPGEPCTMAASQSLLCFRGRGGLAEVRQLDRPGIVRLVDARGRTAHALLTAFNGEQATLGIGGVATTVPLAELARVWRGEFATFWRAPPGYREGDITSTAAGSAWLAQRLTASDGQADSAPGREGLRSRVAAFQLANGLMPDGVAGPLTLMQLARANGSDEPRLARR